MFDGNDEYSDCSTTTNRQVAIEIINSDEQAIPLSVPIAPENYPVPSKECRNDLSRMRSVKSFMMEEIDPARAPVPLVAYCFMAGFMYVFSDLASFSLTRQLSDAVSFSAIFVWCAFQTGNFVQVRLSTMYPV